MAQLHGQLRAGLGAALANRAGIFNSDLDDFAQDAILRVLNGIHLFRGQSSLETWAMAVAIRVAMTALRRRRWADQPISEIMDQLVASDVEAQGGQSRIGSAV